jgi:hypothetical protein
MKESCTAKNISRVWPTTHATNEHALSDHHATRCHGVVQCSAEQCRVTWYCIMFPATRPSHSTRGHYPCRGCGGQAACGAQFSSLHHMASQSPDPLAPGTANNNERIRRQLEDSARRLRPIQPVSSTPSVPLLNPNQIKSSQVSHVRRQASSVRVWLAASRASKQPLALPTAHTAEGECQCACEMFLLTTLLYLVWHKYTGRYGPPS